jgi:hypothetical protein
MVKFAETVEPAGMVTLAGGVTAGSEDCSSTAAPPAGAGPVSRTEAVVMLFPPGKETGLTVNEESDTPAAGVRVTTASLTDPA